MTYITGVKITFHPLIFVMGKNICVVNVARTIKKTEKKKLIEILCIKLLAMVFFYKNKRYSFIQIDEVH